MRKLILTTLLLYSSAYADAYLYDVGSLGYITVQYDLCSTVTDVCTTKQITLPQNLQPAIVPIDNQHIAKIDQVTVGTEVYVLDTPYIMQPSQLFEVWNGDYETHKLEITTGYLLKPAQSSK